MTHARTHARTHAARTHAHTHTHAHAQAHMLGAQDWDEARIAELAKGCARATVGGLAKMILPTLLKTQCAAEGAAPPVEVWDGNVKDTVKVMCFIRRVWSFGPPL